jgi:hypothetical protein
MGIALYKDNHEQLKRVKMLLGTANSIFNLKGDYLLVSKQPMQASFTYESIGEFRKALFASKDALDTKRTLSLLKIDGVVNEYEKNEILSTLYESSRESAKYGVAI